MIMIFAHIKFSRIYGPAQNARKYVLRENFYVYSITLPGDVWEYATPIMTQLVS